MKGSSLSVLVSTPSIYALFLALITFTALPTATISAAPFKNNPQAPPNNSNTQDSFTTQLFRYTSNKQCFFPLKQSDITDHTPFIHKLDELCNSTGILSNTTPPPKTGAQICLIVSDMLATICNKTLQYKSQEDVGVAVKSLHISISTILQENKATTPLTFCEAFMNSGNVPQLKDIRPELQPFYGKFLLKVESDLDKSGDGDGKEYCSSVCENGDDPQLKISPLCLLFNATSYVWKKVETLPLGTQEKPDKVQNEEQVQEVLTSVKQPISVSKKGDNIKTPPLETEDQMGDVNGDGEVDAEVDVKDDPVIENSKNQIDKSQQNEKPKDSQPELIGSVSGKPLAPPSSPSQEKNPQDKAASQKLSSSTPSSSDSGDLPPPPPVNEDQEKSKSSSPTLPKKDKPAEAPKKPSSSKSKPPSEEKEAPLQQEGTDYEDSIPPNIDGTLDESEDKPIPADDKVNIPLLPSKKNPAPDKNPPNNGSNKKETFIYNQADVGDDSGGYFNYFLFFITILALCFLAFHNKRRFLAYILEGRKPRGSRTRRRSSSNSGGASYRRLENNFE